VLHGKSRWKVTVVAGDVRCGYNLRVLVLACMFMQTVKRETRR